jgi:hypothetical protein
MVALVISNLKMIQMASFLEVARWKAAEVPVVLTLLMAHLMLVAAALWIPIVQSWSGCCLPSAQ